MPTLYEIMKKKIAGFFSGETESAKPKKPEDLIYNPIGARVGCSVTIDDLDYRGKNFFVREIRESVVRLAGKTHKFVDYVVQANMLSGETVDLRVRIVPEESKAFGHPYRAMVLSRYDSLAYDEGLHNVVRDDVNKNFKVDDEAAGIHDEFWRVNDVGISYSAEVKTLAEKPEPNSNIEFWDYSRMTNIEGVELEQFLFVEMNKSNGWFEIWKGNEINPEQVMVL
jgi:hypothetical protein